MSACACEDRCHCSAGAEEAAILPGVDPYAVLPWLREFATRQPATAAGRSTRERGFAMGRRQLSGAAIGENVQARRKGASLEGRLSPGGPMCVAPGESVRALERANERARLVRLWEADRRRYGPDVPPPAPLLWDGQPMGRASVAFSGPGACSASRTQHLLDAVAFIQANIADLVTPAAWLARLPTWLPNEYPSDLMLGSIIDYLLSNQEDHNQKRSELIRRALTSECKRQGKSLSRAVRAVQANLPPYQPEFADALVKSGLPLRRFTPAAVIDLNTGAGVDRATPRARDHSALVEDELRDEHEPWSDVADVMDGDDLFQLLFWVWVFQCDEPDPEVRTPPEILLAALSAGLGHAASLREVRNSDWWWYRGARIHVRSFGTYLTDVLLALDVVYENLSLLRPFDFEGYAMGRETEMAFNGQTGGIPKFKFNSSLNLGYFGLQSGRTTFLTRAYAKKSRRGHGDRSVLLANGRFRPGVDGAGNTVSLFPGDCAAWELRKLVDTMVHEQVHRAFSNRGLISAAAFRSDHCDGNSMWATPVGTNHFYCSWLGANFVDKVWRPLRFDASGGGRTQADLNRITMRQTRALWCKCSSKENSYQGRAPSQPYWDWECESGKKP